MYPDNFVFEFKFYTGIIFCLIMGCTPQQSLLDILPSDSGLPGWEEENSGVYAGEEALSTYINGGARLYGSYGFEEAAVRSFSNTEGGIFSIELYRMKDTRGAYGVYTFNRSGKSIEIESLGCYDTGLLQFWKGNYYGRLLMFSGLENPEDHLISLSEVITGKIGSTDDIPSLMKCLPNKGLVTESARYIVDYVQVNNLYYLGDYDVLKISAGTEGVYAEYEGPQNSLQNLLIIKYKSTQEAESAGIDFIKDFAGFAHETVQNFPETAMITSGENDRWNGIHRHGEFLILVFEAVSEGDAGELIKKTKASINAHQQEDL